MTRPVTRSRASSEASGSMSFHGWGGKAWKDILFQSGKVLASWIYGKQWQHFSVFGDGFIERSRSYSRAMSHRLAFPVSRRWISLMLIHSPAPQHRKASTRPPYISQSLLQIHQDHTSRTPPLRNPQPTGLSRVHRPCAQRVALEGDSMWFPHR